DAQTDHAAAIGDPPLDGLPYPPRRVGGELVTAPPIELLDGADETQVPLLDEVEEGHPGRAVAPRDRNDQPKVLADHPLARVFAVAPDAFQFRLRALGPDATGGETPRRPVPRLDPL